MAPPSASTRRYKALCAASLERHVIAPNRHRWDIDVVGHSWSPEIGQTLDALFAPKRAVHEQGMSISNFKCPNPSFNLGFCHRTVSHVLGITKAMRVKEIQPLVITTPAVYLHVYRASQIYLRFGARVLDEVLPEAET